MLCYATLFHIILYYSLLFFCWIHIVIQSFPLKLLRYLQFFLPRRLQVIPQLILPETCFLPSFSLLPRWLTLILFLWVPKRQGDLNSFKITQEPYSMPLKIIIRCFHVTNFKKIELPQHQLWSFPSRRGKRVFVWVRIQPKGFCPPLWGGWVGGPFEKHNIAASIALRTSLHLIYYKQTGWEWVLALILQSFGCPKVCA